MGRRLLRILYAARRETLPGGPQERPNRCGQQGSRATQNESCLTLLQLASWSVAQMDSATFVAHLIVKCSGILLCHIKFFTQRFDAN